MGKGRKPAPAQLTAQLLPVLAKPLSAVGIFVVIQGRDWGRGEAVQLPTRTSGSNALCDRSRRCMTSRGEGNGLGGKAWAVQAQMRERKGRERDACPGVPQGGDYSSK